jgi:hypothetical protein
MQNLDVSKTIDAWSSLAGPPSEAKYQKLVTFLLASTTFALRRKYTG